VGAGGLFLTLTKLLAVPLQGNTGVLLGLLLVSFVILVALVTVLSGIGIGEHSGVGSGGVYSMISSVLGGQTGGTIGLLYVFGQVRHQHCLPSPFLLSATIFSSLSSFYLVQSNSGDNGYTLQISSWEVRGAQHRAFSLELLAPISPALQI
jgi:hypothetical protein